MMEKPWLGYFAVAEERSFKFLFAAHGEIQIMILDKDAVILKHLDGKRVKLACVEATDSKSKEVNGPGSSSAEVEISVYQKRNIEFLAAPNSSLTLVNAAPDPLHNGFWLHWSPDAAKDPEGKAKLAIRIR